jgi:hypothetical protein
MAKVTASFFKVIVANEPNSEPNVGNQDSQSSFKLLSTVLQNFLPGGIVLDEFMRAE